METLGTRDGEPGTVADRTKLLAQLDRAMAPPVYPSEAETQLVGRLREYRERLIEERFQLAVVGQFKRGKSTLLNTLLGMPVLPSGVVPLTAIATFVRFTRTPTIRITAKDGTIEEDMATTVDAIRAALAAAVTETGNPHNEKQLSRVEIGLPSAFLASGLVVIDTPGIGSAERHNSETALAALPQCDAALFVVSPDPPISEAEIAYIDLIAAYAATILPVLNKIDLVRGPDRDASLDYLGRVLHRIGIDEPVLAVSAIAETRSGAMQPAGDGLERLRDRLQRLARSERQALLARALAVKTLLTLDDLRFHNELAIAALTAPLEELTEMLAQLQQAMESLTSEQVRVSDYLEGEARRIAADIDADAAALRAELMRDFSTLLDRQRDTDRQRLFAGVTSRLTHCLDRASAEAAARQRKRLETLSAEAMKRAVPLLERAQRIAADVLGAPFRGGHVDIAMPPDSALAWVQRPAERMNPLPPHWLDLCLPAGLRRRRLLADMRREMERLVTVNVETLRWHLIQSANGALHAYGAAVREALAGSTGSVTRLVEDIRTRRTMAGQARIEELSERRERAQTLDDVASQLRKPILPQQ